MWRFTAMLNTFAGIPEDSMRKRLIVLCGSLAMMAATGLGTAAAPKAATQASRTSASAADVKSQLPGTWKLLKIELLGPKGEVLPAPAPPAFGSPNPVGFLMYDPAGYMGVTVMQSGRQKYAGQEPTPAEAKAALESFISYFGTFSVDEAKGIVTHHVEGSLNPNMESEPKRFFQLSGHRLTLLTPPSRTGSRSRLIWERLPDLKELTPEQRRFIGFWKPAGSERRTADGQVLNSEPRSGRVGYLIYTRAGYMAVHLMDTGRKKFAAAQPTPEEAQMAIRSYGSAYHGPFTIRQAEGIVVHHQLGMINPGGGIGTDTLRGYEFVGNNRLILRPPAQTVNGQKVQNYVSWERVTPPVSSRQ
jgi:hypothetical protein